MDKKKTPQNHQEGQAVPDPIFTANTVAELSQKWFEEWKPYLETDGEKLLGDVLATMLASMAQLREGHQVQHEALGKAADFARGARLRFEESTEAIKRLEATQLAQMSAISKRLEKLEGR